MGLAMHLLIAIIFASITGGSLLMISLKNLILTTDTALFLIVGIIATMVMTFMHFRADIFHTKMAGDREGIWKRDAKHKLEIQKRENKRLVAHQLGLVDLVVYLENQLLNGRGRIYNRLTLSPEHRNLLQLFAPSATPIPTKPKEDYSGPERRSGRMAGLRGALVMESDEPVKNEEKRMGQFYEDIGHPTGAVRKAGETGSRGGDHDGDRAMHSSGTLQGLVEEGTCGATETPRTADELMDK